MSNRIAHYFQLEHLLDPRGVPAPPSDPAQAVPATPLTDTGVDQAHPLELYFPREQLIASVEEMLENIQRNRTQVLESPNDRAEIEALVSQRVRFLHWLQRSPDPLIFVAVYPAPTFEDVEVEDEDEEGWDG